MWSRQYVKRKISSRDRPSGVICGTGAGGGAINAACCSCRLRAAAAAAAAAACAVAAATAVADTGGCRGSFCALCFAGFCSLFLRGFLLAGSSGLLAAKEKGKQSSESPVLSSPLPAQNSHRGNRCPARALVQAGGGQAGVEQIHIQVGIAGGCQRSGCCSSGGCGDQLLEKGKSGAIGTAYSLQYPFLTSSSG